MSKTPEGSAGVHSERWERASAELPTVMWSGSFRLFGVDVACHTLSDSQRIIEADSMRRLLDAMIGGPGSAEDDMGDESQMLGFMAWRKSL